MFISSKKKRHGLSGPGYLEWKSWSTRSYRPKILLHVKHRTGNIFILFTLSHKPTCFQFSFDFVNQFEFGNAADTADHVISSNGAFTTADSYMFSRTLGR